MRVRVLLAVGVVAALAPIPRPSDISRSADVDGSAGFDGRIVHTALAAATLAPAALAGQNPPAADCFYCQFDGPFASCEIADGTPDDLADCTVVSGGGVENCEYEDLCGPPMFAIDGASISESGNNAVSTRKIMTDPEGNRTTIVCAGIVLERSYTPKTEMQKRTNSALLLL